MRTHIARFGPSFLVPLILLTVGCGEPAPTEAILEQEAALIRVPADQPLAEADVPLRIEAGATLQGQDFAPGFGPPIFGRSTFDGRCSDPADMVIRFSVEGQAAHLGRFTASAEHCSRIDFQTGRTEAITDGAMVFVAANGDELWSRYDRGSEEDSPERHEFIGGTGRFSSAGGGGAAHVACDRASGTCLFQLVGFLRYDASDRSR